MTLTLRPYQESADLVREAELARLATQTLPWAGKPTRAPSVAVNSPEFDPRSRAYAVVGSELIGSAGFLGDRRLILAEYPWVLPGHEGELQERLLNRVEEYARDSEFGARLSRISIRKQWTDQIKFLLQNGYQVVGETSMILIGTAAALLPKNESPHRVVADDRFDDEFYFRSSTTLGEESEITSLFERRVLSTLDFDTVLKVIVKGELKAQCGVAIRADTGFAELRFLSAEAGSEALTLPLLEDARETLLHQGVGHLGVMISPILQSQADLVELGYLARAADLILEKSYTR